MAEPFDEYADQFTVTIGGYGSSLTFMRTNRKPSAPGSNPQSDDIGTIRMSVEHLKTMVFVIHRHVIQAENNMGVQVPVPAMILNTLQIAPEDWERFWRRDAQ